MHLSLPETRARRLRGFAVLLGLLAFAMTGCLRYEMGIVVNADGSGTLSSIVAISDKFAEASGARPDEAIGTEGLPRGAEVREYREDGYTGIAFSLPFADVDELAALTSAAGGDETGFSGFTLEQDGGGGWQFEMTAAPGGGEMIAGADGLAPADILDGAWFRIRVTLPGELVEHNADRIENGTLVWDLDLAASVPRQLTARTAASAAAAPAGPVTGHGAAGLDAVALPAQEGPLAASAAASDVPWPLAALGLLAVLALVRKYAVRSTRRTPG